MIEHRTVMEDRPVPQVKSLYPFSGQGMVMAKGEVSIFEMISTVYVKAICVLVDKYVM